MAGRDLEMSGVGQGGVGQGGVGQEGPTGEADRDGGGNPAGRDGVMGEAGPDGGGGVIAKVGPSVFVRLKLRLIAGNLRNSPSRVLGFVFTLVVAIVLAGFGFFLMASLRLAPEGVATDVGIILFTVFLVGWAITPLLAFGLDETLDPSRLSLFPLRTGARGGHVRHRGHRRLADRHADHHDRGRRQPGHRHRWRAAGRRRGAAAVRALHRHLPAGHHVAVRNPAHPQGRDVLAVSVVFFVLAAQLPNLLLNGGVSGDPMALLHGGASVLRWTPSGMAAHAIADGGIVAVAELLFLAALVVVIGSSGSWRSAGPWSRRTLPPRVPRSETPRDCWPGCFPTARSPRSPSRNSSTPAATPGAGSAGSPPSRSPASWPSP
ncbi:hypothetical protein ACFQX6_33465 [Streptosporangium lutulentum]